MMQTKLVTFVLVGLAVFVGAWPAAAQRPGFTVTVDEFGKGTLIVSPELWPPTGQIVPIPIFVVPDPLLAPGFAPTPVVYNLQDHALPDRVLDGDVILEEPPLPGTNQTQSDLLRFGGGLLYVYSDVSTSDPAEAPADVGVPPASTVTPVLVLPETGSERFNGLFGYTPGPGMPGYFFNSGPAGLIVYNFISDTPEPSTLVLAALAFAGLAMFRRRTRS